MKKILLLLVLILMVAGCNKTEEVKVSDGDTVLFEVNGEQYTKNDLYKVLVSTDASSSALSILKIKLAQKENIDLTEIEEQAQEYADSYAEYYPQYDGLDEALKNYYLSYFVSTLIEEHYAKQDVESYISGYNPIKAQFVYFDDQDTAKQFIEEINKGSTFEMAAAALGYEYDCAETIYTERSSELANEVKTYCVNASATGLSDVIPSATETTDADGNTVTGYNYYVVNITSNEPSEFIDEFASYLVKNSYIEENVALNMLFKNHEITIHNQDVYDTLTKTYEALEQK